MRISIDLAEPLIRKLEERAASTGSSVSQLTGQAVGSMLSRRDHEARFEVVTFEGKRGARIGKASALLGREDEERYGRDR